MCTPTQTHTPRTHDTCTHLLICSTYTCRQHTHVTHAPNTHLRAHIQTHSHHTQTSQTDTQRQTHITLGGTPHTTDAQTHRDTCDFSWVVKQGAPPAPAVLGHIPGEPSLTRGLIKSGLQETRKLNLGPFLCSGYCA